MPEPIELHHKWPRAAGRPAADARSRVSAWDHSEKPGFFGNAGLLLRRKAVSACLLAAALAAGRDAPAASIECLGENPQAGLAAAVVVEDYALAHSAQLLPLDNSGHVVGEGSVDAQLCQALFNLEAALAAAGTGTEHLVKINFYVDGPKTASAVRAMLTKRFPAPVRPALSWVATRLPHPQALLALDAVAAVPGEGPEAVVRYDGCTEQQPNVPTVVAVLPRGQCVYVSGQSVQGELPTATAKTLESLLKTIGQLGLEAGHVVHVKAFLSPMEQAEVVRQEVAKAFAGHTTPPLTLVEWSSSLPIEIEMIAFAPAGPAAAESRDTVSYFTSPEVKPSPVYSRVARVHGGKMIYVSGLYADKPGSGEAQVRDLFASLQSTLQLAGGDLRHLVKATYYCSDNDASEMLNKLRPEFYDPQRPPAASKAMVRGVAVTDRSVTMDMIAVTPP